MLFVDRSIPLYTVLLDLKQTRGSKPTKNIGVTEK